MGDSEIGEKCETVSVIILPEIGRERECRSGQKPFSVFLPAIPRCLKAARRSNLFLKPQDNIQSSAARRSECLSPSKRGMQQEGGGDRYFDLAEMRHIPL